MNEHAENQPRPLQYEPKTKVMAEMAAHFKDWSEANKNAFLTSFIGTDDPGHLNAYRLCAGWVFPHPVSTRRDGG